MKIFFLALLSAFIGGPLMSQSLDLTKNVKTFSAAGIPVILKTTESIGDISDEIVAIQLIAHGGVNLSQKPGVLGLLAQLMSKGTYSFSKEDIDRLFTRTGASFAISPDYEEMTISLKCLKGFLPELFPVISEMMRVPLLSDTEFALAKSQLENDLKGEQDVPEARIRLLSHKTFYKDHPFYSRPTGYLESLPTIQKADLSTALFRAFTKDNLLAVVVGPLNQKEVEALFEEFLSSLPEGKRVDAETRAPNNPTDQIFFEQMESPTSYVLGKFNAPNLSHLDYPALHLALNILDNRLFDEVRTKRAFGYSVSAGLGNSQVNSGYFYVMTNYVNEAVEVILEEVRKLQLAEVEPELIDRQIRKFLTGWYKGRETRSGQAQVFALYELLGMGWETSNSFIQRLEQVSPQQIREVMNRYFQDVTVTVVGGEKPELEPVLQKFGLLPAQALTQEETSTAP